MPTSNIDPFELLAIRYARHTGRRPEDNYIGHVDLHDAGSDLAYYVWLARRGDEIYVIDTGFDEAAARQRGRELLLPVHKGLEMVGVAPASVKNVILTHLHYDHAGTLGQFPSATFHIQDAESAYATGRCMTHATMRAPYEVEDVVGFVRKLYDGRVVFHQGDSALAKGLTLHWIGGHTAGLQVVRVWTSRGWVVVASDASHLYGNFQRGVPFPIVHSVADMLEGHRRVLALADSPDHVIPGHDPLVMAKYPAYSAETDGWVVSLDKTPKPH